MEAREWLPGRADLGSSKVPRYIVARHTAVSTMLRATAEYVVNASAEQLRMYVVGVNTSDRRLGCSLVNRSGNRPSTPPSSGKRGGEKTRPYVYK